jgi:hypothetical protein
MAYGDSSLIMGTTGNPFTVTPVLHPGSLSKSGRKNDPNSYEPKPISNALPAIWPLVIDDFKVKVGIPESLLDDMALRDAFGRQKYGVPLQPFNGRDPIRDAYQEALDLCVYAKQACLENPGNDAYQKAYELAAQCVLCIYSLL